MNLRSSGCRRSTVPEVLALAILAASCAGGRATPGVAAAGGAPGSGGAAGSPSPGLGGDGALPGTAGASGAAGAPGTVADAGGFDTAGVGFAADFTARANAALAAGAPSWACATALPNVPVADAQTARDAIRMFIAGVVGVPAADIMMNVQPCSSNTPPDCAVTFAHDTAKSGGAIYAAVDPLAKELEANATSIEETIWVPMQDGLTLEGDVVMSGISDGVLVGMVVFNAPYACR